MLEVTCGWALHAETEINTLIWRNARLAKLVLLWSEVHRTNSNFIPRILNDFGPSKIGEDGENYNDLKGPNAAYKVLDHALGQRAYRARYSELDNFIKQYWPYFSPVLNWKIRVNFTEGQVPSIII